MLMMSSTNYIPCNLFKCKELVLSKKGQANPSPVGKVKYRKALFTQGIPFSSKPGFHRDPVT